MVRWFLQCLRSTTTQTHLMGFNNIARFPYFAHHIPFPIEKRASSQRKLCNCFTSMTDNRQFWTPPRTRSHTHFLYLRSKQLLQVVFVFYTWLFVRISFRFFRGVLFTKQRHIFLDVVYIHVKKVTVCVCIDTRTSLFPGCQNTEFLKFCKSECENDYMHLPYNK